MYLDVMTYRKCMKDTRALAGLHPLLYYFSLWTGRSGLGAFLIGNTLLNLMMVARSSFPSPFEVLSFQYPQFRNKKRSISCVLQKNKLKNNLINYYQLVPFFSCFSPLIQTGFTPTTGNHSHRFIEIESCRISCTHCAIMVLTSRLATLPQHSCTYLLQTRWAVVKWLDKKLKPLLTMTYDVTALFTHVPLGRNYSDFSRESI